LIEITVELPLHGEKKQACLRHLLVGKLEFAEFWVDSPGQNAGSIACGRSMPNEYGEAHHCRRSATQRIQYIFIPINNALLTRLADKKNLPSHKGSVVASSIMRYLL
jgi:hypothetical protein